MKGDFSRFTFDRKKHYNGLYLQQGRVQIDADWNELVDINAAYNETLVRDVIGPCGMPAHYPGFEITAGGGLEFNGKNNFIYAGKNHDLSFAHRKSFTMEAWLQPQKDGGGGIAAGRFYADEKINLKEYFLRVNPDQTLSFQWIEFLEDIIYDAAVISKHKLELKTGEIQEVVFRELTSLHIIPYGEYSFITVTVDQNRVSIYINSEIAATCKTGNFVAIPEGQFLIGSGVNNRNQIYHAFNGAMEQIDLWDHALPPDRIKENMTRGLTGKENGLIRLWRFNQGSGDKVPDLSEHSEPCLLGGGRKEYSPTWLTPGIRIGKGRCYNHGIPCHNETDTLFTQQPDYPGAVEPHGFHWNDTFLFYLDTWNRFITAVEDPNIREIALEGPDTATRTRTVSQVKWIPGSEADLFFRILKSEGKLKARHNPGISLRENRLYRVEIHTPGVMANAPASQAFYPVLEVENIDYTTNRVMVKAWQGGPGQWQPGQYVEFISQGHGTAKPGMPVMITSVDLNTRLLTFQAIPTETVSWTHFLLRPIATFKWSRENGAVVLPIKSLQGNTLTLNDPYGYGSTLKKGDWLEVVDDNYVLKGKPMPLCRIYKIEHNHGGNLMITLAEKTPPPKGVGIYPDRHPLVRLWDQKDKELKEDNPEIGKNEQLLAGGVIPLRGGEWMQLEEGIEIYFEGGGIYHHGDYWWIPARSGNEIQWPVNNHEPISLPPHGIRHHYAPLAIVEYRSNQFFVKKDMRHIFQPLVSHNYNGSFYNHIDGELAGKEPAIEPSII
ncbi:MAG: LamG domain-containing protein [Acidobacteria bacterium]|jgi:hypothetical protein|nr:LamG domain-containing protein [Acidobacteriota bacterium]